MDNCPECDVELLHNEQERCHCCSASTATPDGWVCTDCAQFIANGDVPEEGDWSPDMIRGEWALTSNRDEFSWSPCSACRSRLGGERTGAFLMT